MVSPAASSASRTCARHARIAISAKDDTAAVMGLDREGKQTFRCEQVCDQGSDQRKIRAIDKDIRGEDQVEAGIGAQMTRRDFRSGREHRADHRCSCDAPARSCRATDRRLPSSRRHGRNASPGKPGAAAEIEHGAELRRTLPCAGKRPARLRNSSLRRRIRQSRQRVVEFRRILVEHRADIVGGHGVATDIEQLQPKTGALPVGRIGFERLRKASIAPSRSPACSLASRRDRTSPRQSRARVPAPAVAGQSRPQVALGTIGARHLVAAIGQ